jgi:sulfonate transport system ATP-binding protein
MTQELHIAGLTKAFGAAPPVLGPLSLTFEAEGLTAIVGRSGCGKSTLLRCLAGLERPSRGSVLLGGAPIRPEQVGYVFQEPRLMPWLNVRKNVAFGLRHLRGNMRENAIEEALSLVGLLHAGDLLPKQLSGGMAQRVALARALAPKPEILLLDEPFSALDPLTREQMQAHVLHVSQHFKATMVLITHDMDEALMLATRVIALRGQPGRIVADWVLQRESAAFDFPRDRGQLDFQRFRRRLTEALEVGAGEDAIRTAAFLTKN